MDEKQLGPQLYSSLIAPQKKGADANEPEGHHRKAGRLRHRGGHREIGRGESGECVASICAVEVQHASKYFQVRVAVTEVRRKNQARQIQALIEVDEESSARRRDPIRDQAGRLARAKRGGCIVVVIEVLQHNHIDATGWNSGRQGVHEMDSASRAENCRIEREDIRGNRKAYELLASDYLPSGSIQDVRPGERVCIECERCCMRGRAHYSQHDPDAIFIETQFITPLEQELRVEP